MKIISGPANPILSQRIGDILKTDVLQSDYKKFPDDEIYVRILGNIVGEDVVIVQSTWPNDNLIALLLLKEAAHAAGADNVHLIIPYFSYARQNRIFKEGEAPSARALMDIIGENTKSVTTVDLHKEIETKVNLFNLSAVKVIATNYKNIDIVFAPDEGASERAAITARILGVPSTFMTKTRKDPTLAVVETEFDKHINVEGKNILLVDDMISTGNTIQSACQILKNMNPTFIEIACTHGLFTDAEISRHIRNVSMTDTIERHIRTGERILPEGISTISVANMLAEHIHLTLGVS